MTNRFNTLQSLSADLRFGKSKKLKTDEISSVFSFKHQEAGEFLRVLFKPNQIQSSRLAVVISKKLAHHAVERNYCKRIVRELFRTRQHRAGSLELVILVRKKFTRQQFEKVAGEFDLLLAKITRRY